ncbi:fasciclin domain-containing protein [Roseivirga sp. E12]|uniref:fasciclin domain-containing protein n=1 Tax=Roseivirga sp. E12 TaxID=2819237 RepID=UPI001ABCB93F|nr:fasciclin domain-containing protein [Roseivirga sp. E12]MBO3699559.1 fasciclin domain-containing protein [Roseivirga sp. E12]
MKATKLKILVLLLSLGSIMACNSGSKTESSTTASETPSHLQGQASVEDNESDKNILQVAIGSEAHSTLVVAVQAAQIENILVNAGPLTVFAPVNDAFAALPEGTVDNLLKPENKGDLTTILTRHAAPGSYNMEDLKREASKGRKIYMATGDYLEVVVDGEDVWVAGAKVLASIQTSNGIINVVDKVILP